MTNADKIRKMTDEELALMIMPSNFRPYYVSDNMPCPRHIIGRRKNCQENCTDCVLAWLKKEATDD